MTKSDLLQKTARVLTHPITFETFAKPVSQRLKDIDDALGTPVMVDKVWRPIDNFSSAAGNMIANGIDRVATLVTHPAMVDNVYRPSAKIAGKVSAAWQATVGHPNAVKYGWKPTAVAAMLFTTGAAVRIVNDACETSSPVARSGCIFGTAAMGTGIFQLRKSASISPPLQAKNENSGLPITPLTIAAAGGVIGSLSRRYTKKADDAKPA